MTHDLYTKMIMWKLFGKCISLLPSEQGDDNPRWFIRWSCAGGSLSQCVIGQTHIFQMDTLGKLSQFDVENQPFDQPFVDYFPGETIGFPDFFVCLPHQEKTWRKSHSGVEDGQDFDSTWRSNGLAPALLFQAPGWHREAASTAVRPHAWNRWFSIGSHRSSEESGCQRGEHSVYQRCWMVVSINCWFFSAKLPPGFC